MGPTGPGPGYRASTARSSHCNTQGITFLKPRLEWVHGGFRIRGPQGPGPVLRQRKPPSPKNHPPTTKFLATSTILWLVPGGNRIGIQKSRITEWRLCLHEKIFGEDSSWMIETHWSWPASIQSAISRPVKLLGDSNLATFFLSHAGWMAKMPLPSS